VDRRSKSNSNIRYAEGFFIISVFLIPLIAEFSQRLQISDSTQPDSFLKVNLFQKKKENLPSVQIGQIILLQNLQVGVMGTSCFQSTNMTLDW